MCVLLLFFFFKQKTAYEMRISDWSSDVCSSDLHPADALYELSRHREARAASGHRARSAGVQRGGIFEPACRGVSRVRQPIRHARRGILVRFVDRKSVV